MQRIVLLTALVAVWSLTRYFVNRLERLGYEVTLTQEKPAA